MPKKFEISYGFPNEMGSMAMLHFKVELSDAQNIRWDETQKGLLDFFAMCSGDFYLQLARELRKCAALDQ